MAPGTDADSLPFPPRTRTSLGSPRAHATCVRSIAWRKKKIKMESKENKRNKRRKARRFPKPTLSLTPLNVTNVSSKYRRNLQRIYWRQFSPLKTWHRDTQQVPRIVVKYLKLMCLAPLPVWHDCWTGCKLSGSPPLLFTPILKGKKYHFRTKPSTDVEGLTTYFPPKDKEDFSGKSNHSAK